MVLPVVALGQWEAVDTFAQEVEALGGTIPSLIPTETVTPPQPGMYTQAQKNLRKEPYNSEWLSFPAYWWEEVTALGLLVGPSTA